MKKKKILSLFLCILLPLAVGGLAAFLSRGGMDAFAGAQKPPFTPPAVVFPIVWGILYVLMGVASWLVLTSTAKKEAVNNALKLYGEQLLFNFLWPIFFFTLSVYFAALLWLAALWIMVLLTLRAFWKIRPAAGALLLPYLVWLTLAAYLNLGVALLN